MAGSRGSAYVRRRLNERDGCSRGRCGTAYCRIARRKHAKHLAYRTLVSGEGRLLSCHAAAAADRLAQALDGRYRLERELGQVGMATARLAHDVRDDRKVAIKVLKPELPAVLGAPGLPNEDEPIFTGNAGCQNIPYLFVDSR